MTLKTIIILGENSSIFHQLNRWLSDYRLIPITSENWTTIEQFNPGLAICLVNNDEKPPFTWWKQQQWLHKIPTLFVQAEGAANLESLAEAFSMGLADFCEWPCNREVIQQKVRVHFKKPHWIQVIGQKLSALWHKSSQPLAQMGFTPAPLQMPNKKHISEDYVPEKGVYVHFFGVFSLCVDKKRLPDDLSKKQKSLLAYLLYHSGQFLHREKIMEVFWPEVPTDSSRNSLNVAISQIRAYLRPYLDGHHFISYQNEGYVVNPGLPMVTDVNQFKANCKSGWDALRAGQQEVAVDFLEQASQIYQQDFMLELQYEEWCSDERDALKETFLSVLNSLALYYHQKKEYEKVIPLAERILIKAPFLEDTHRLLIDCFDRLHMRGRALNQYQKCKALLVTHFQVEPSPETQALLLRIKGKSS